MKCTVALVLCFVFFFPEVIFFSRVFGARAVTTGRTFGDEFM